MPGAGPVRVITDLGVLAANPQTGELELEARYPGVSVDNVRSGVGWELAVHDTVKEFEPPAPDELRLLREVVDPNRHFLG